MKKALKQLFCLLLVFACVVLVSSCQYFPVGNPELEYKPEQGEQEKPGEDKVDLKEKYNAITVSEAIELAKASGEVGQVARVYGIIDQTPGSTYGDTYLTDGTNRFYIYGIEAYQGLAEKPAVGDEIVLEGKVLLYKGETPEMERGTILEFIKGEKEEIVLPDPEKVLTVTEALEVARAVGEAGTTVPYKVAGKISTVSNPAYGEMYITDGVNELYIYGVEGYTQMEEQPVKGYDVVLKGILHEYKGNLEMSKSELISYVANEPEINDGDYQEVTIEEARNAEEGTLVKLTGVVAQITYASGMVPSGVMLVDETNAIYVYGRDVAGQAKIGNTITVVGAKTYYVLEKEQVHADKFGYKGCNQIENATIIENDKQVSEFNKEWIEESTVKEIMNTPVTEDITTTIFKVNALINRSEGASFVNYYINDLDGTTGTYVYTQANGSDFEWLDQFDGKICTVYLTVQNAKSSDSGCLWRLLPIEVIDEGFEFDFDKTSEFVLEYYGVDQFEKEYQTNPALVVATKVSNQYLGFADVEIKYSSSDESVLYFEETADGLVFNTKNPGTAVITLEASYNGNVVTREVEITVSATEQYDSIDIAEAIAKEDGTVVIIRGIIGSSIANQKGFYLFDETGMIAVVLEAAYVPELETLKIGQELVIQGTKTHRKNDSSIARVGQINIDAASILVNYYGEHEIPYANVITGKTVDELYNLNAMEDHTTEVYEIQGILKFIDKGRYVSVELHGPGSTNYLGVYCSGPGQYASFEHLVDQEVTMKIAMCNWNNKTYYATCILSMTVNGETVYNTCNFPA